MSDWIIETFISLIRFLDKIIVYSGSKIMILTKKESMKDRTRRGINLEKDIDVSSYNNRRLYLYISILKYYIM